MEIGDILWFDFCVRCLKSFNACHLNYMLVAKRFTSYTGKYNICVHECLKSHVIPVQNENNKMFPDKTVLSDDQRSQFSHLPVFC